ncbi:putative 3-dehydrosphinganine reductase TSC10A-like isoform [Sesbania bispinosa]|nr:putative 3-dehydrosphinganine reductase TSC10A-like isoform [Sesbania bispinosa]
MAIDTTFDYSHKFMLGPQLSLKPYVTMYSSKSPTACLLILGLLHFPVRPRLVKIETKILHVFIIGGSSCISLAQAHSVVAEGGCVSILTLPLDKIVDSNNTIHLALRRRSIIDISSGVTFALAHRGATEGTHVSILAALTGQAERCQEHTQPSTTSSWNGRLTRRTQWM